MMPPPGERRSSVRVASNLRVHPERRLARGKLRRGGIIRKSATSFCAFVAGEVGYVIARRSRPAVASGGPS